MADRAWRQAWKTPKKNFAVPQTREYRGESWPGLGRNRGIPFAIPYRSLQVSHLAVGGRRKTRRYRSAVASSICPLPTARAAFENTRARSPSACVTAPALATDKRRVPPQECPHLCAVFFLQHRAGDVGDPAFRLEQGHSPIEHFSLLLLTLLQRAGPHSPFGVGVAPPGSGARAWRIDKNEVHAPRQIVDFTANGFRSSAPERCARPSA